MGLLSNLRSNKQDVFAQREKQQRVWQTVRRLVNQTTPPPTTAELSERDWERHNRCVPVACVPMITEEVDTSNIFYGATKDFSDNGVSIITSATVECSQIICGFWIDDFLLLNGIIKRTTEFGGDLNEIGIEFTDVVDSSETAIVLRNQLQKLQPVSKAAANPT